MRAVVTRVNQASVSIDGAVYSEIGSGLLVLLGSEEGDTQKDIDYIRDKVCGLRIYEDAEGKMNLSFEVQRSDFGRIRMFEPSDVLQADGYAAQITRFKATALRSYATLEIVFDRSISETRRLEIVTDYLEGLGVPEGKLNAIAGEGEEIVIARSAEWSEDGLTSMLELRGNPREDFQETMVYCPHWGMHAYEGEGEMPPLSADGAVWMEMKEVRK